MQTQTEVANSIVQQLRLLDPAISAEIGTPERKLIDVIAQQIAERSIDLNQLQGALDIDSKFGSDLDPTTKRTIERGRRNQEILKQKQYSPVRVELQVAIIYLSTKGFLDSIPVESVKAFEIDFYNLVNAQYQEALTAIKKGDLDTAGELLKKAVNELAPKYARV